MCSKSPGGRLSHKMLEDAWDASALSHLWNLADFSLTVNIITALFVKLHIFSFLLSLGFQSECNKAPKELERRGMSPTWGGTENSCNCRHHFRNLAEHLKATVPSHAGSLFRPLALFMEGLVSVNALSLAAHGFLPESTVFHRGLGIFHAWSNLREGDVAAVARTADQTLWELKTQVSPEPGLEVDLEVDLTGKSKVAPIGSWDPANLDRHILPNTSVHVSVLRNLPSVSSNQALCTKISPIGWRRKLLQGAFTITL